MSGEEEWRATDATWNLRFLVSPQGPAALSHLIVILVQSPFMLALESSPILYI